MKHFKKLNSKGFSHIEALLVLAVVAVVGVTGFYVWNRNKTNNTAHAGGWTRLGTHATEETNYQIATDISHGVSTYPGGIPNCPSPEPVESLNVNGGDCVKKLQVELNFVENAGITVDGIFGTSTQTAVMQFQKANGLTEDGVVGAMTWAKLDSLMKTSHQKATFFACQQKVQGQTYIKGYVQFPGNKLPLYADIYVRQYKDSTGDIYEHNLYHSPEPQTKSVLKRFPLIKPNISKYDSMNIAAGFLQGNISGYTWTSYEISSTSTKISALANCN